MKTKSKTTKKLSEKELEQYQKTYPQGAGPAAPERPELGQQSKDVKCPTWNSVVGTGTNSFTPAGLRKLADDLESSGATDATIYIDTYSDSYGGLNITCKAIATESKTAWLARLQKIYEWEIARELANRISNNERRKEKAKNERELFAKLKQKYEPTNV